MKIKQYGNVVEHAGTGLHMPEGVARLIDTHAKGLPQDFSYRRLAKTAEIKPDEGTRTDISFITTNAVDRQGECVLPSGGDWADYNRVVTMAHDYSAPPVGSNQWLKAKDNGIIAKTFYPPKPKDWGETPWLPSAILHLMQQDPPTCTGKSIGFLPLNIREASASECAMRPELKGCPIIDKWKGIEYAVAPVPCNPEAEMLTVSKSVQSGWLNASLADLLLKYMGAPAKTEDATEEVAQKMIDLQALFKDVEFVRPESILAAAKAERAAMVQSIPSLIRDQVKEIIDSVRGRV